jgi:hypothetical protein
VKRSLTPVAVFTDRDDAQVPGHFMRAGVNHIFVRVAVMGVYGYREDSRQNKKENNRSGAP